GFRLGIGGTAAFPEAQIPDIAPMRLGSRRIITIPPNLGYGGRPLTDQFGNVILNSAGTPLIPACSTLIFDVTLVDLD
ncbi:MAG TPA: FKBP-type peptidyl-prolyl cis-trans isomerase, partial [Rubricoccaceae bacterium]